MERGGLKIKRDWKTVLGAWRLAALKCSTGVHFVRHPESRKQAAAYTHTRSIVKGLESLWSEQKVKCGWPAAVKHATQSE